MKTPKTTVIIPACNEEKSIGRVVSEIPKVLVHEILVVDNGSTDKTSMVASRHGARVISEPRRGYGTACLAGIKHLDTDTEVVVFMDGDHSDFPEEICLLLSALREPEVDMVIGSRVLGRRQKGSLTLPQRFGNWLSTLLIKLFYGHSYTDLGPFRAIRAQPLKSLGMQDRDFGWTVEMQVKALQRGLKVVEIPVSYRKRIGTSKVSGTVSGSIKAGFKILWTIGKLALRKPALRP